MRHTVRVGDVLVAGTEPYEIWLVIDVKDGGVTFMTYSTGDDVTGTDHDRGTYTLSVKRVEGWLDTGMPDGLAFLSRVGD